MARRWLAVALLSLFLASSLGTAEAWTQYRGDVSRSALLDPLPTVLDVVEVGGLRNESVDLGGMNTAPVILHTGTEWLWSERHAPSCLIVTRAVLADRVDTTAHETPDCDSGLLQGYDATRDLTLLCTYADGDEVVLQAIADDGGVAWSVTPNGTLGFPGSPLDEDANNEYRCLGTAIDEEEGIVYTAFHELCNPTCKGLHRIAALRLDDGGVVWKGMIRSILANGVLGIDGTPTETSRILPAGITLMDDHLLVTFTKDCGHCAGQRQAAIAWFDRDDGTQVGDVAYDGFAPGEGATQRGVSIAGSRFALALDEIAVTYQGGFARIIDPSLNGAARSIPVKHDEYGSSLTATPVVWNQVALVPSTFWLSAVDIDRGDVTWDWTGGPNWYIEHVAATADGDVLVLLVDIDAGGGAKLVRLAAMNGHVVQELPIALDFTFETEDEVTGGSNWKIDVVQAPSGDIALVDHYGAYALLGAAGSAGGIRIDVSDAYPATGDALALEIDAPPRGAAVEEIRVAWGDGTRRIYAPGEPMTHRYAENGDRDIFVTLVHADGTTRSAKATVHVGDTAPRALTPIQQVFAPENADVVWGVVGLIIALTGGLIAFARARMRKNRLDYKLAQLERLKGTAEADVSAAIHEMMHYRERLRQDLHRGKVDDIQYAVLEGEAQRALRLWFHRLVSPYGPRLSERFRRRIHESLEDGTLHAPEASALLAHLDDETRLKRSEKETLRRLFAEWTTRDAGDAPT